MFGFFLPKKSNQSEIPGVHIYFSNANVIVAPLHQTPSGVHYEQSVPIVLEGIPDPLRLGEAFCEALGQFSIKSTDLGNVKSKDWPAFVASQLRTIREFERSYRSMTCYSTGGLNRFIRAEMAYPGKEDVDISTSFNLAIKPSIIGEKLLGLLEAADIT